MVRPRCNLIPSPPGAATDGCTPLEGKAFCSTGEDSGLGTGSWHWTCQPRVPALTFAAHLPACQLRPRDAVSPLPSLCSARMKPEPRTLTRMCRWTLGCMLQNHLDFAKAHYVLAPGLHGSLSSQLTPAVCGCGGKATGSSKLSKGNVERQLLLVRPCHAPSSPPLGAQGWATQWSEPL